MVARGSSVRHWALGVGLTGIALAVGLAAVPVSWPTRVAIGLAVVGVASTWLPLRAQRESGIHGVTFDEAVLVALLAVTSGWHVPVLLAAGVAAGHLALRTQPTKALFNIGQVGAGAAAAAGVFHLIGPGTEVLAPRWLLAAGAATTVFNVVSLLALGELFRRLENRRLLGVIAESSRLATLTWLGNTTTGVLLALVATEQPWAIVLPGFLMVGLYLGYRGYARLLEERRRREQLHEVTRVLVDAMDSPSAVSRFLTTVVELFGGRSGEVLLVRESSWRRVSVGPDGNVEESALPDRDGPVQEAMRRGAALGVAEDESGTGDQLRPSGHRSAIAAPMVHRGRTLGGVAVYDRAGLEPWDETDVTLLASLANEVAVALRNVELFAEVRRERALLAEESRKLGGIVDATSDGIAMIESDGLVAVWNEGMAQITGLDSHDAVGQPWFVVMRLKDAAGNEVLAHGPSPITGALGGERTSDTDLQILRRDGEWRWLRCSVAPVVRGEVGVTGAVVVARDVTREREVEGLKSDFVSTVSHELRTPLTPLRGFVETLVAKNHLLEPDQLDEVYRSMRGQVDRLDQLVGDLLLVADLDSPNLGLDLGPVDIAHAVELAVAHEGRQFGVEDRVHVTTPDYAVAVGELHALTRVLRALISNAAKHTDGAVEVRVRRESEEVLVDVLDHGPGIPPWEHDRVFERFVRLGNHLHRTQGPGLGLPIAQALVHEIGGELTLASDVNSGSCFQIRLPAAVPEDGERQERPAVHAGGS